MKYKFKTVYNRISSLSVYIHLINGYYKSSKYHSYSVSSLMTLTNIMESFALDPSNEWNRFLTPLYYPLDQVL